MSGRYLALAIIAAVSSAAMAREIPLSGQKDARMRTVAYDPTQVVRLSTIMGTALVVTFAGSEKVSAVAVTDSKNLIAMPRDNFLFLKSRGVLPSQPVIVLTRGPKGVRRYVFEVEAISAARQAAEQRDIYYSVEFRYPADRAEALLAARQQRERLEHSRMAKIAAERERERVHRTLEQAAKPQAAAVSNWQYVARGSRSLVPDKVYDDGSSTFFLFRGNRRMPAVFRINPDGGEAAANVSVKGDWMVVGAIGTSWRLRDGRTSLTIWNRGYNASGHAPVIGTVSSAVRRVIKDNPK